MDSDVVIFLAFVFGVLLFFMMVGLLIRKGLRMQRSMMEELAKELGVPLGGGDPLLPGIPGLGWIRRNFRIDAAFEDRHIQIFHFSRGSGKNRRTYATVRCFVRNDHGLRLHVAKENFLTRLGRNLGMPDVEIGDQAFDTAFVVKSKHPDFARTVLVPELRDLFFKAWDEHAARGYVKIDGDSVRYEEAVTISRGPVKRRFLVLTRLCAQLAEATEIYSDSLSGDSRGKS